MYPPVKECAAAAHRPRKWVGPPSSWCPDVAVKSAESGTKAQERRATYALLAVMNAVKEFGRTLTRSMGAHAGDIETFIEVEFDLDGKKVIRDGLIRVSRSNRVWTSLVEVKTGRNDLQTEQLENHLEVARRHGIQALLTISNQTTDRRWRASDQGR